MSASPRSIANFREAKDFETFVGELSGEPADARRSERWPSMKPRANGIDPNSTAASWRRRCGSAGAISAQTRPNPAVGALIVRDDDGRPVVVGRGWTAVGGRPHAETQALSPRRASAARGATVYVTLEPCAHQGATPPCADALIAAGVARVVDGDGRSRPARQRAGARGAAEAPGIAVTTGVLAEEARARPCRPHLARHASGRPHVTLKLAVSADGMIGRREGERMIITGTPAFDAVQAMRAEFDAIMVGIGTVLVDDPRLTVRLAGPRGALAGPRRPRRDGAPAARLEARRRRRATCR